MKLIKCNCKKSCRHKVPYFNENMKIIANCCGCSDKKCKYQHGEIKI